MSILTEPGVLCRLGTSATFVAKCKAAGIVWVAPQTWNKWPQAFSLDAIKTAGLAAPVWGVTYDVEDFTTDGTGLAISAVQDAADGAIIDAEVVLDNADPDPLWAALDAYTGPKALSCEGNGTNPDQWPLPVHVDGAVARGYVCQPQAYLNAADFLTPANAITEWMGHGFPRDGIAPCISLAPSESDKPKPNNRMAFAQYVPLLEAAGVGRHFSIFADTDVTDQDFIDIGAYLLRYPKESGDVDKLVLQQAQADFVKASLALPVLDSFNAQVAKWRTANPREAARYDAGDYDVSHYTTRFGKALAGFKTVAA